MSCWPTTSPYPPNLHRSSTVHPSPAESLRPLPNFRYPRYAGALMRRAVPRSIWIWRRGWIWVKSRPSTTSQGRSCLYLDMKDALPSSRYAVPLLISCDPYQSVQIGICLTQSSSSILLVVQPTVSVRDPDPWSSLWPSRLFNAIIVLEHDWGKLS